MVRRAGHQGSMCKARLRQQVHRWLLRTSGVPDSAQCRVEVDGVYWQGLVLKSSLCSIQEMQKHHLSQVWCLWAG